jgi:hypothetical protein
MSTSNHDMLMLLGTFYGLIVLAIGSAAFVVPRKVVSPKLRESLWLLGTFGLLHGLRSWMLVAEILAPSSVTDKSLVLLTMVGTAMNAMALLCLGQFTSELIALMRQSLAWTRWVPLSCFTTWLAVVGGSPVVAVRPALTVMWATLAALLHL